MQGGVLIVKFGGQISKVPFLLNAIFVAGIVSVVLGTLSKLIQTDVKRTLACSTMGQMGFMFVQCGLGFFSAAVAHLMLHGLYKAYFFLNAGSTVQESKSKTPHFKGVLIAACSAMIGLTSAFCFSYFAKMSISLSHSALFLILFAWFAGTQLSYFILEKNRLLPRAFIALCLSSLFGSFYGGSVHFVESAFYMTFASEGVALNGLHLFGMGLISCIALLAFLMNHSKIQRSKAFKFLYVKLLNFSAPHPSTVTIYRNEYKH